MKILFDHQIFASQKVGGISRVFREIIEALARQEPEWTISLFAGMHRSTLLAGLRANKPRNLEVFDLIKRPPGALGFKTVSRRLNPWLLQKQVTRILPEVFYPTWYDDCTELSLPQKTRTVVVVHDLAPEIFPCLFREHARLTAEKRRSILKANVVVAVSNTTRDDLLLNYPSLNPDYVISAPLATRFRQPENLPPPDHPYLLYVGYRGGYKNFIRLAEAFASSPELRENFKIVCVGGGKPSRSELGRLQTIGLKAHDLSFVSVDDSALSRYYAQAAVFVYPSLYEGFGLPILEAMACRTPVVAARAGAIPEVAGDAAILFEPENTEDLRESIKRVIFDSGLRRSLVDAGERRQREFSWDACARRHRQACLLAVRS